MNKLFAILLLITAFACNPQKRLNRLAKNHPELVKSDTVKIDRLVTVPGYQKDTSAPASTDLSGLYALIDHLCMKLDSAGRQQVKSQVGHYILNRPCLEKPFFVLIPGGGFVKIWQENGRIQTHLQEPTKKYKITVPLVSMTLTAENKYSWSMLLVGIVLGFFLTIIGCMAIFKYHSKKHERVNL